MVSMCVVSLTGCCDGAQERTARRYSTQRFPRPRELLALPVNLAAGVCVFYLCSCEHDYGVQVVVCM